MSVQADKQYATWGVLVQNSNLRSSHVATGVVQTLRALPGLAERPRTWGARDVPATFDRAVRDEVARASSEQAWRLSPAAISLAVTNSGSGPTTLTGDSLPLLNRDRRIVEAGLAHVEELFGGNQARLTRAQHELIEGALNADGTVRVAGASDPTTPGAGLAGYTSTHSLAPMHAATYLGALARGGSAGRDALAKLHGLVCDDSDAHTKLADLLQVSEATAWPALDQSASLETALPFPSGAAWDPFIRSSSRLTQRLLTWHEVGNVSKQEILMAVIDLVGLLLMLRMLGASSNPGRALLLVASSGRSAAERSATECARRSLRAAQHRLDIEAKDKDMVTPATRGAGWQPSSAARTLGLATGWLYPRDARGGAKHFVSPGVRQFVTLCQCLLDPHDDVGWPEFHERVLALGMVMGAADEGQASKHIGPHSSREAIRRAGKLNQERMIELGLARHESDGVVRVTGGF